MRGRLLPWKALTGLQRSRLGLPQQATPKIMVTSGALRKRRPSMPAASTETIKSRHVPSRKQRSSLAASKKTRFLKRRSAPWKALTGIQRWRLDMVRRDQANPNIYQYHQQIITNQIHHAASNDKTPAPVSVSKVVLPLATSHSGFPQAPVTELSSLPKAPPSRSALDMPSPATRKPHSTSLAVLHSSKARLESNCKSSPAAPHTPCALSASLIVPPTSKTQQKSICTSFSTATYTSPTSSTSLNVAPTSYTHLKSKCTPSSAGAHTPLSLSTSLNVPPTSEMTTKSHYTSPSTASPTSLEYLSGDKFTPQTVASQATFGSQNLSGEETETYLKWIARIPLIFSNIQTAVDSITSSMPNLAKLRKRRARIDRKIKKLQEEREMIDAIEKRACTMEIVVHTLDRELKTTALKLSQCKKSLRHT